MPEAQRQKLGSELQATRRELDQVDLLRYNICMDSIENVVTECGHAQDGSISSRLRPRQSRPPPTRRSNRRRAGQPRVPIAERRCTCLPEIIHGGPRPTLDRGRFRQRKIKNVPHPPVRSVRPVVWVRRDHDSGCPQYRPGRFNHRAPPRREYVEA